MRKDWIFFDVDPGEGCTFMSFKDEKMIHPWDIAYLTGDPIPVYITFWTNRIYFTYSHKGYHARDRNIVQYIYQLIKWIEKDWMLQVLLMLPFYKVDTLQTLCKFKICEQESSYSEGESLLRRRLTPIRTLIREFSANRKIMSGKDMLQYFTHNVLPSFEKCYGTDTESFYENSETIFMHEFNLFGGYPEIMHFSTLHHLLLLESILWERHVWYELFPGTHVCEIEMVINRQIHIRNVHGRIFYNRDLANYMDMCPMTYDSSEVNTVEK